jgi:serine O-acetyltransferase
MAATMASAILMAPTVTTTVPSSVTTQPSSSSNSEGSQPSSVFLLDDLSLQLREEALETLRLEPELCALLHHTVLAPGVVTFEDAVASTLSYRMLLTTTVRNASNNNSTNGGSSPMFCPHKMKSIFDQALQSSQLEAGHTMSEAIRKDALAVIDRDPAVDSLLEVVLFNKGYAALVCHRAARHKWYETIQMQQQQEQHQQSSLSSSTTTTTITTTYLKPKSFRKSYTALFLQSQASAVFAVDIHPAATMGAGIMLDHGTGIVIGETAHVGDGCTLLQGVTLGGTGKDTGDRHPKVGANVLIGANASILGNIQIGRGAKIGAGSIVLRAIPSGATAVGVPAKIIGHAKEQNPGSDMDETLQQVSLLHKSSTVATLLLSKPTSTTTTSTTTAKTATASSSPSSAKAAPGAGATNTTTSTTMAAALSNSERRAGAAGNDDSLGRPLSMDDSEEDSEDQEPVPEATRLSDASSYSSLEEDASSNDGSHGIRNGSGTHHHDRRPPPPHHHSRQNSENPISGFCPFRNYTRLAQSAPPGAITIVHLQQLLKPLGCTGLKIGQVFFELDTRDVGYFYPHPDMQERVVHAIAEHTHLTKEQAEEVVLRTYYENKCGGPLQQQQPQPQSQESPQPESEQTAPPESSSSSPPPAQGTIKANS